MCEDYFDYYLVGEINDISLNNMISAINSIDGTPKKLNIKINSSGGSVASALAMYNFLKSKSYPIATHNLADTSSAAILLYLAGNERTAENDSKFIVHPIIMTINNGVNYYQLKEFMDSLNADINCYIDIISKETNNLNEKYDIRHTLTTEGLILTKTDAFDCGIVTKL